MFGTDGVRGTANKYPMVAENILKLGMAAAVYFNKNSKQSSNRVIVAKDPRLSGYLFENAITAGLLAVGKEVFLLGPMPTPGLAFLSRTMRADFGVMISASHNLYYDNGIKLFDSNGYKLFNHDEQQIENLMSEDLSSRLATSDKIGRAARLHGAEGRYIQYIKGIFPNNLNLSDLKIVIDCANGAAYKVAPNVLYELGSTKIIAIGVNPDGYNINDACGSTNINNTVAKVLETGANVGIAVDGDADRLVMVDEKGNVLDGDILLAIIATYWNKKGSLAGKKVVGTILTNWGAEQYFNSLGIELIRTQVGDKYIIEYLKNNKLLLGGETSGHIVLSQHNTTSDGLLACLEVLKIMLLEDVPLSVLANLYEKSPQIISNVLVANKDILNDEEIQSTIKKLQLANKNNARIIVRASGTESVIRVMVEGNDNNNIKTISNEIEHLIKYKNNILLES
ncbi:phosphoglucosamine mutase [Rickettsiales bacterium LUAb2]